MGFPLAAAAPIIGAGISAAGNIFGGGKQDSFNDDQFFDMNAFSLPDIGMHEGPGGFFDISQDPGMLAELDAIRKNAARTFNQFEPGALEGATGRGFRVNRGDVRNKLANMAGNLTARQSTGAMTRATQFRRSQYANKIKAMRMMQMMIFQAKARQAQAKNAGQAAQGANSLAGLADLLGSIPGMFPGSPDATNPTDNRSGVEGVSDEFIGNFFAGRP